MIEALLKEFITFAVPSIIILSLAASIFIFSHKIDKNSKMFDIVELVWIICTVITIFFTVSDTHYKDYQDESKRIGDILYQKRYDISHASARFLTAYCMKMHGDHDISEQVRNLKGYCADMDGSRAESNRLSWAVSNLINNPSMEPYSNQPEYISSGGASRIEQEVSEAWADVKSMQSDFNFNLTNYIAIKPYVSSYPPIKFAQLVWYYFYAWIIGFRLVKPTLQLFGLFGDASTRRRKGARVPVKRLIIDPNVPSVGTVPDFIKKRSPLSDESPH